MLRFLKIFSPKNWAFLTRNKAKLSKFLIITLVFEKNANFFLENYQKSQKIVIITSSPVLGFGSFVGWLVGCAFRRLPGKARLVSRTDPMTQYRMAIGNGYLVLSVWFVVLFSASAGEGPLGQQDRPHDQYRMAIGMAGRVRGYG
jgi:hypothetical protein